MIKDPASRSMLSWGTDDLQCESGPFVRVAEISIVIVRRQRFLLGRVVGSTMPRRIARVRVGGDGTRDLDEGFLMPVEFDDLVSWDFARDEPLLNACM